MAEALGKAALAALARAKSKQHRAAVPKWAQRIAPAATTNEPAPVMERPAPQGQRLDRVLYLQGRRETAELLRTMVKTIERQGSAEEVFARLRKGAESKPASYAVGVEELLVEVEALVARHEMQNQQNVALDSWR